MTSLSMYHASELFIIKDVLDIYTQQIQNNKCMLNTTCLESKAAGVYGQKVKTITELLLCTFAMYDCRQLEDVSSVENVHLVTEILSQVFIRCCHLYFPPLSSVVPQAFGAFEHKGTLYMTSYRMFTCRPFSFQYFHASNFTSNSSMDSALITRSSLYNRNYGQSVLNSVNRASYIIIKSSGIRTEP